MADHLTQSITERIIPLPHDIQVDAIVTVTAGTVKIKADIIGDIMGLPALETGVQQLSTRFGSAGDAFVLAFAISDALPAGKVRDKLYAAKNRDQAYAILPIKGADGAFAGLTLAAFSGDGFFYAVQTILQAAEKLPDGNIIMPALTVVDWPDIPLRGQWGCGAYADLKNTSTYKLNALDSEFITKRDSDGVVRARFLDDDHILTVGAKLAVHITPYMMHIEQLTAVHPYCFDEALIERIKNKPSPGADEVCDYKPSLCMSNEAAFEFLCTWLGAMADRNTVKNMLVWLSEGPSPCCCEKCTGKEQFVLETSMLLRVFDWIRERRPDMNFEILLTQGSYPLNDKICEMVPEYVRVVYYDGGRTYVSDRNPIIYDMLTMYVKRGQRLGVYPQISHSWRECFPWSGLDFIRFRCQEFFEKGLNKVIAFTQPDNFHNRNNVIAMAEWLWNTKGRNESEFARALALKKGYDPDHYAHWNRLNMSQAWDLAASRFMLSSIFCYPVIHKDNVLIADHRTELAGFTAIEKIEEKIAQSEKAVEFAKQVGFEEERLESLCMLHTLKCSHAFQTMFLQNEASPEEIARAYEEIYESSGIVFSAVLAWDNIVRPPHAARPREANDCATVLLRVADKSFEVLKEHGLAVGAKTEHLYRKLGEWEESVFATGNKVTLQFDVSEILTVPGVYSVAVDFIHSAVSCSMENLKIFSMAPDGSKVLIETVPVGRRLDRWEPWFEVPFMLDNIMKGNKVYLYIELESPADEDRTCRGIVGLRKV